ncbi:MAG: V-type ATP synthase subunit B, partial [Lachnospiraceae bacterium]|nr:V-type ATP synthase subunit B [Lachnospiraceae bacterium]
MKKIYSKIESIIGNVITVRAEGVGYGELARIKTSFGTSLAEVNRLAEGLVSLQVFAGGRGISTGDTIEFLGHPMQISFSDNIMGRVFGGNGSPRDHGPALADSLIPIG